MTMSVPKGFGSAIPKCFQCQSDCDVDPFGDLVCQSCGESQKGVFDLFGASEDDKPPRFDIVAWRRGDQIACRVCNRNSLMEDPDRASVICMKCGSINAESIIDDGADWNNYESSRESGRDNSRVGWFDESNPYSTLGSSIKSGKHSYIKVRNKEGKWVSRDLAKINQICSANSKEKSFYEVIKKLNALTNQDAFNQRSVDLAKIYWNEIVKKDRIFRGGNRSGIIACCVLYACYDLNVPMDRDTVAQHMFISSDDIVKGEPIFKNIMQQTRFRDVLQKTPNMSNSFVAMIDSLELPFKVSGICQRVYNDCEEELSEISSQSATGGVIAFVVTRVLGKKKPSKKEIAEKVGVSVPTITNSMKIINRIVSPDDY